MFPAKFKMHLRASDTLFYGLDSSGAITVSTTPYAIVHLPKRWEEAEIGISRSTVNLGLLTQLTSTYAFTLDAAKILRYVYYREGVNGQCFLDIYKTDSTTQTYGLYYSGKADFTKFEDAPESVSIDLEQAGLNAVLFRDRGTVQEIPLEAADSLTVALDGVALRNRSLVRMTTPYGQPRSANSLSPQIVVVKSESDAAVDVIERDSTVRETQSNIANNYPFFKATAAGSVTIDYDVAIDLVASAVPYADFWVQINHRRGGVAVSSPVLYSLPSSNWTNTLRAFSGTLTLDVQPGDTLAIWSGWAGISGNAAYDLNMDWQKGLFTITYNARQEQTITRSYGYGQLLEKVIAKLSPAATVTPNVFNSGNAVLRDCNMRDLRLAPSEAARGISAAKFKVSWADFEKDLQRYGLGASADGNTLNIRPVTDFFQNTLLADLGEISDVRIVPALGYLFNTVKAGAKAGDNDALQGRYEINAPQVWQISNCRAEGERDMVSPFISGMYAVEQIRSARLKDTTNQSDDNRILLLEAGGGQSSFADCTLTRKQNAPGNWANGLLDDAARQTAFNLSLSPARDLLRNGALLSAQLAYPAVPGFLQFVSGEREGAMYSKLGVEAVPEKSFFGAAALGSPPFLPVLFQFEAPEPPGLYVALQNNPHGYLQFTCRGKTYKGFIDEITLKPGNEAAMECSLLAHSSTDLSTLIR